MSKMHDVIKYEIATGVCKALLQSQWGERLFGLTPESVYKLLEKPPQIDMGDLALPCFRFAGQAKTSPKDIAGVLEAYFDSHPSHWVDRLQLTGAFLNFFVSKAHLATHVLSRVRDDSHFQVLGSDPDTNKIRVMVEFSQPNTHKEFHVGHARNVALGDSLCRILKFAGYQVIPVNYIGDEGAHVAKCLWQIKQCDEPMPVENQAEWFGKRYVEANQKIKAATAEDEKAQIASDLSQILANLEKKEGMDYDLWLETRKACLEDFHRTYHWLNVHFEHYFYESEVSEESQTIVDEFLEKGVFKEDKGAIGIDMSPWNLGFFMARKSDGTSLYITKDLALARKKFQEFQIDKSVYVVGSEQNFHFQQLFKALEIMGFPQASQCYHLSYALVKRPDGKMSSRAGNAYTFRQLANLMTDKLGEFLKKYESEWTEAEVADTAQKLAVAAIKYGMIGTDPNKEIVFDPDTWTSFDGNSGPYLAYSYARTQSILRKGQQDGMHPEYAYVHWLEDSSEQEILRFIYDFNEVVLQASQQYKPSLIAHHLYDLARAFNRFYAAHSVLKADTLELVGARLALVEGFAKTMKMGLSLLGITPPERM